MGHRHAGPPHAPATRGLVLPRSRLPVGSTRDAHLVRRAAARRADRRAGGWALALLARTKVRSPARPRARHLAPCPAPRSPRPRAPLSALAGRSRYSPCPPAPLAGARRPRPQAPRMRGAGGARARASQAGWCLCASSVLRVRVFLREFTNPHTNTHKHTARAAENALELTIDLRGGGVAVEEWMRGGGYGGKGEATGSERGGESARCRGCQGDAPRGPGARWRRRGGRLLAVRRRPEPAKTRRAAAQSEAGRGAGEWVGFKVQGVG